MDSKERRSTLPLCGTRTELGAFDDSLQLAGDGVVEGGTLITGGRIDVRTGEVWPRAAIEYATEPGHRQPR
jgi:hypothetical protein